LIASNSASVMSPLASMSLAALSRSPARLGPQLLEVPHPALLSPLLLLRLADAIDALGLRLPKARQLEHPGRPVLGGEVGLVQRRDGQIGSEDPDVQLHVLEVLPP
jgi:hypothetical protein